MILIGKIILSKKMQEISNNINLTGGMNNE
jgi:hypothetical protein